MPLSGNYKVGVSSLDLHFQNISRKKKFQSLTQVSVGFVLVCSLILDACEVLA